MEQRTSTQKLVLELYREKWNNPKLQWNELLRTLYVEKDMTMKDIAETLHVSTSTVHLWLKKEGIATRRMIWL